MYVNGLVCGEINTQQLHSMEVFKPRLDGALSALVWVTRQDQSQVGLDDLGHLFQPKPSWHVVILSMTTL